MLWRVAAWVGGTVVYFRRHTLPSSPLTHTCDFPGPLTHTWSPTL